MFERARRRNAAREERTLPDTGRSALILAIVILAIMAMAITIDFSSVPGLAVLTILVLGSLIAALAAWG
jgi:protein-S-isoprenylcysteine O-methyltransferase Ste14